MSEIEVLEFLKQLDVFKVIPDEAIHFQGWSGGNMGPLPFGPKEID